MRILKPFAGPFRNLGFNGLTEAFVDFTFDRKHPELQVTSDSRVSGMSGSDGPVKSRNPVINYASPPENGRISYADRSFVSQAVSS